MGSMNMGPHVFVNTPPHLEAMALAIRDAGVLPELEVFETGHLLLAKRMIESGHINAPGMFQICLGIAWAQPATPEAMSYMRSLLPATSPWFAFGISLYQFPMVAQAVLLGGHPRVGLEDNIYLEKGKLARSSRSSATSSPRPPMPGRCWDCRRPSRSRNRDECSQRVIGRSGLCLVGDDRRSLSRRVTRISYQATIIRSYA
jgi:hypothetical protein